MNPVLVSTRRHVRKSKPVDYIIIIVRKILTKQSLNIFKHEGKRLNLSNSPYRLRKHISMIVAASVLSSKRKWLARRASTDQHCSIRVLPKVVLADIALNDFPVSHMGHAKGFVATNPPAPANSSIDRIQLLPALHCLNDMQCTYVSSLVNPAELGFYPSLEYLSVFRQAVFTDRGALALLPNAYSWIVKVARLQGFVAVRHPFLADTAK